MFKLWRRNKDKGGVKTKKSRKIALIACAAALLASVTGASIMLGLNSHSNNLGGGLINTGIHGNTASSSALSVPSSGLNTKYDYEMSLKGTPAQMAKIWDEAISQTGKHVLLKLEEEEWKAPGDDGTYGTSFGLTCTPAGEGELYVPVNITITLDLNGNTIDRNRTDKAVCQDGMVIWIDGGTLNIIDSSGDDSGKITGGYEENGAGGIWQDAGALNLYGGQITGNYCQVSTNNASGAGVYIKTGTFNMYGGKITDNGYLGTPVPGSVGTSGGGVALVTSGSVMPTFNMYGGEISNNKATEAGGVAIFGDSSTKKGPTFNMYGGKITGNTIPVAQDGCGGGVYPYSYGTFNMFGGEISDNTAANAGGGVAITSYGFFNMKGGKITNNTALRTTYPSSTNKARTGGGGIYIEDSSEFVMDGGEITENKAHDGGGINAFGSSTVTINDGLIAKNECYGLSNSFGGAGIAMGITGAKSTLNLNGGKIINNGPNKSGEGVAVKSPSVVNIGGPVIMYGNCYDSTDGSEANLWVSTTGMVTVTDKLIKNGQAAHIGVLGPSATNANLITNTTPDNLCGYDYQHFFFSENPNFGLTEYNPTNTKGVITSYNIRLTSISGVYFRPIMWSFQTASGWRNCTDLEMYVRLPYGEEVTAVKAEYTQEGTTNDLLWAWPNGTTGATNFNKLQSYVGGVQTESITNIKNVGSYNFALEQMSGAIEPASKAYLENPTFTIEIVPRDITVVLNDDGKVYGAGVALNNSYNDNPSVKGGWKLADGSTLGAGDDYADLGIQLKYLTADGNISSYNVGSYAITGNYYNPVAVGTGASYNSNYNITFENAVFTITQREITVIVNNAEAEYGEKKYTLNKDENKTAVKGKAPIAAGKDADGFDVDADGDRVDSSGNKIYNGGWRYSGDSATDTDKQFIAADINKTKHEYPIQISCSGVETESASYIAVGTYDIIAKTSNPNYKITVLNADGTAPAGGVLGKGTFTVSKATIEVLSGSDYKTLSGNDPYDSKTYKGNNETVSIPTTSFTGTDSKTYSTGAVILKGAATTPSIIYRIFDSDGKNVTTPTITKPTQVPEADDATFWGSSDTTVKEADSYTVYAKISAANHADKVYVFTYEFTGQKTELKLIAKWGTSNVAKTDNVDSSVTVDANKAVYDGTTKLTLDKTYVNTDANSTNCPLFVYYKNTAPKSDTDTSWKWGAWSSTLTRLDSDTTSPKHKYSADKKFHEDYGTTEEPKDGGTYTITVVVDPDKKGFTINGLNSLTVTVNAKEVAVPKGPTTNPVYNGTEQEAFTFTYNTSEIKVDSYSGNTGYGNLTEGDKTDVGTTRTQKYKATNADKYAVIFALTDTDNYKWKDKTGSDATADQKVELTLDRKAVKVTFNPPDNTATTKWTWKAAAYSNKYITYAIDESSLCDDPADNTKKEAVTVNLLMCKAPKTGETAEPIMTYIVAATATELAKIDVTNIDTGDYVVYATLVSDTDNAVNKNYIIEIDETTGLPKTVKQTFKVDNGEVSLSGLSWVYTYTKDGDTPDPVAYEDGKLVFALNKDGSKVTYTVKLDTDTQNGFPEYLDASNVTYTGNEKTDAGEHTLTVTLHIKDGFSYKFDQDGATTDDYGNDATTGYHYVSDTEATVTIPWKIGKAKVDLSGIKWGYTVDGDYEEDGVTLKVHDFRKINTAADGNDPVYKYEVDVHGVNQITPVIKADSFDANIISLGSYTGSGVAGDIVDGISTGLTTNMQFTLANTNFEFGTDLGKVTLNWEVTKATLAADSTWKPDGTLTDSDGKQYKTPVLTSATDPDISDKVEYVYEYNGKTYHGVEGLKELYKEADGLNGGSGGALSGVTVKAEPKSDYQKDANKEATGGYTETATIGDSRRRVEVKASATSGQYSEASLEITLLRKDNGADVTSTLSPKIYVYSADADGKLDETTKKPYSAGDLKTMNAGKYFIGIEVDNPNYILIAGQETFAYEITKVELALPTLEKNPIFDGTNIEIEKSLVFTDVAKDLVVITGQGATGNGVRNVQDGAYTLTITLTEEAAKNYKWKDADSVVGTKFTLTQDSAPDIRKDSDSVVKVDWRITPLVLNVKPEDWNLKGKTPVLNLSKYISEGVNVSVEYSYYANESDTEPQDIELKGGSSVWVAASLKGLDAGESTDEAQGYRNVILANDAQTTPKVSFTVQQSGVKAALGSAVNWAKNNWWILVAIAAALIFLIILICIIKHRKKTKEAREEKKEKREEDKRRREAEREAARAKQEAELELAKAKQEAELAKIRAAAGAAGMAGMAMQQQQPQQQAMQQPQMQQPQQMPQPQMQQYPQQQQMPQQMPMMPMPQQMQSSGNSGNNYDNGELRELKSEIANMRAEQRSDRELAEMRREMELGFAKFRAENGNQNAMNGFANMGNNPNLNNADMLGAVLASMVRNLATGKPVEMKPELELPHSVEESKPVTISAPTAYPADAVITTTTTVDTTNRAKEQPQANPQPRAVKREPRNSRSQNNGMFDIDGFYDAFDENK